MSKLVVIIIIIIYCIIKKIQFALDMGSIVDAPPNSLIDSTTSPKVKTMEE
jgi:hypothetical protein